MCESICTIQLLYLSFHTDAVVVMNEVMVNVSEANGLNSTADICVDSGITGYTEIELTVSLNLIDGEASEFLLHEHVVLTTSISTVR